MGAGRKKGSVASHTLAAAKAREILIMKITAEIEPIAEALLKKAKMGDVHAIRELFDRAFGRATQPISATDTEGNSVPITSINIIPISVDNKNAKG